MTIHGTAKHIRASPRARTEANYLGTPDEPLQILPGMVAQVDVLTGKKTVLQYLLTPVIRAKSNALRER